MPQSKMTTEDIRQEIDSAFSEKAAKVTLSSKYVKVILVLGGSLIAGIAAFFSDGFTFPWSPIQILGVFGAIVAFCGGIFVALTDDDSTHALVKARQALDDATEHERTSHEIFDILSDYEMATETLYALYTVMSLARGALERAISNEKIDEEALIKTCLETTSRNLVIALDLEINNIYTICVYRGEQSDGGNGAQLKCVAHHRSVECDISNARIWREGVGVGGIAFAKNDEVVVPDVDDPALGTAFRLDKDLIKDQDSERYKSMFAVPITVGSDKNPWGVVLATSNEAYHFGSNNETGVEPEEAVRALSGVVALAVAVCRFNSTSTKKVAKQKEG